MALHVKWVNVHIVLKSDVYTLRINGMGSASTIGGVCSRIELKSPSMSESPLSELVDPSDPVEVTDNVESCPVMLGLCEGFLILRHKQIKIQTSTVTLYVVLFFK